MPKIQEIKNKTHSVLFITLPKFLTKIKNLKKGDKIEILEENGRFYFDFKK
jgi:hypothetical protein